MSARSKNIGNRLRHLMGFARESEYVRDHMDYSNMRTSLYMASVMAGLEVWMMWLAVIDLRSGNSSRASSWFVSHFTLYILLLIAAVTILLYSISHLRRKCNNHMVTGHLFSIFSLVCVFFGIYISYIDYSKGEQLFTFMAMVVFGLCLVVNRPWLSLVESMVAFSIMYELMRGFNGASYATRINFFVLWICVMMSAIGNYSVRLQHAIKSEEMENANLKLVRQSLIDELTGLKNRTCLKDEASALVGRYMSVAMIDVDNFKYINDTYNHMVGDEVLKKIAELLNERFSPFVEKSDRVWFDYGRFGGDGFMILSSGIDEAFLEQEIREWQHRIHSEIFPGTDIRVAMSCGIVSGKAENTDDISDMVKYSDHILYEAKNIGHMQLLSDNIDNMRDKERTGRLGKRMLRNNERDALTGLPNMIYFRNQAGKMLASAVSVGDHPEFLYMDMVNFKEFNERYGFREGDKLLRLIAERLEELYDDSLVARVSDDHFIIFTRKREDENLINSNEIRELIRKNQRDVKLQLKVGVFRTVNGSTDASLACDKARMACASIKNRFDVYCRIYDDRIDDEARRKHYIINNIDRAINERQIKLYYQPIVQLSDGKISNLEALARWDSPEYGMLQPGMFIDVLEEAHLIHKLDLCMARMVCENLVEAKGKGLIYIPISINLSRRDFDSCDMVSEFVKLTEEFDIPRHLLEIEITESALTDHPEQLEDAIRRFKKEGFNLWLDDFGSGYSSLNVLKDFPFDVVKIDMIFLAGFETNLRTRPILRSVVRLADEIHMRALTEGVETDEEMEFLKSIGCERAQGYLFGKPMDKQTLVEFIDSEKLLISDSLKLSMAEVAG